MAEERPRFLPNAFAHAARELNVSEEEFTQWMKRNVRPRISPSMWSRWERGWKPVGHKHREAFLRARQRKGNHK